MPVALSPEAERDIEAIGDYLYSHNPPAALRFVAALQLRLTRIAEAPRSGVQRPELWPGLRSIPFRRYVIFYTVSMGDHVRIERVLHGSRDIAAVFGNEADEP